MLINNNYLIYSLLGACAEVIVVRLFRSELTLSAVAAAVGWVGDVGMMGEWCRR